MRVTKTMVRNLFKKHSWLLLVRDQKQRWSLRTDALDVIVQSDPMEAPPDAWLSLLLDIGYLAVPVEDKDRPVILLVKPICISLDTAEAMHYFAREQHGQKQLSRS